MFTRSGSDSALATAASRRASKAVSRPTAGAQQEDAAGPGRVGSSVVIPTCVVLTSAGRYHATHARIKSCCSDALGLSRRLGASTAKTAPKEAVFHDVGGGG